MGLGGAALKGQLLLPLVEKAQGTDRIFLGSGAVPVRGTECGKGIGEQKVGKKGLAEPRSVFPVCLFICFGTRINN